MILQGEDMKKLRVYIDTSVVGGCCDKKFEKESRSLFAMADRGDVILIVSDILAEELESAPEGVRNVLAAVSEENLELVEVSEEAVALRDAYMAAEVVGPQQAYDAFHVALATVARADLIVSWNFKHIVHFEKIRGFNAVDLREGYLPIDIRSPLEVV
jgi:predicted nucleic acid-binding protein